MKLGTKTVSPHSKITFTKSYLLIVFIVTPHPNVPFSSLREGTKKMKGKGTLQQEWRCRSYHLQDSMASARSQASVPAEEAEEGCSSPSEEVLPH